MSTIDRLTSKKAQTEFDKKVLTAVSQLHPYVKHRIYIGEAKGILPRNMYKAVDIIDEGIAKLYDNGYDVDMDRNRVKLLLFKIVDLELETLFEKEDFHKTSISTSRLLGEEMDRLKEDYTVDADLDMILNTELDDISYRQNPEEHLYVYTDEDIDILGSFENKDISPHDTQLAFRKIYSVLPMKVSNIVDMHTFGKLNVDEISEIRKIEKARINRIIETVRKRFEDYI